VATVNEAIVTGILSSGRLSRYSSRISSQYFANLSCWYLLHLHIKQIHSKYTDTH